MGWSSFEARDAAGLAASKLKFLGRLSVMDKCRPARQVLEYLKGWVGRGRTTTWYRSLQKLHMKFLPGMSVPTVDTLLWDKLVTTRINDWETERWRSSMLTKSTLENYRLKNVICREDIYDNSKCSDLLFKARAGSLETNLRTKHWSGQPESCPLCGAPQETLEHVLLLCPGLGPPPAEWMGSTPAELLGLVRHGNSNKLECQHLLGVKARLLAWWSSHMQPADLPSA